MFAIMNSNHLNNETRGFPDKSWVTSTVSVGLGHVVSRCIPSCLKISHMLRLLVLTTQPRCAKIVLHISHWVRETSFSQTREGNFLQHLVWLSCGFLGILLELPDEVPSFVSHRGHMRES